MFHDHVNMMSLLYFLAASFGVLNSFAICIVVVLQSICNGQLYTVMNCVRSMNEMSKRPFNFEPSGLLFTFVPFYSSPSAEYFYFTLPHPPNTNRNLSKCQNAPFWL